MTTTATPPATTPSPTTTRRGAGLPQTLLSYAIAVLLAFVVSGIVIALLGHSPIEAFRAIVTTSFKSSRFAGTLVGMTSTSRP